jgi:hypothetical protein
MNGEDKQRSILNVRWDVGSLFTAAAMICGVIVWLVTGQNRSVETQHNLEALQATVTAQIAELRAATTGGLADVRKQIDSLPDQRAQLADLQRRVGEMSQDNATVRAALDARLSVVERNTIELRADLNGVLRASNTPLPTRR